MSVVPHLARRDAAGLYKRCTGCGLVYYGNARKPLTRYFWRQAREPDGLRARCKACNRELPCMQARIAKERA